MSAPLNPPLTPGPEVKFGLWAPPESPLSIEYSLVVIEEIRHEVAEGFQRLSRGGIEVGGVLYGTHGERGIRILALRPIACEHARGPGLVFSDKDRMSLHEQLLRDKDDPQLEGMVSVGWFLSHTRSGILLSESDQEIYSIFFPAPWQVTMVVRPGRNNAMRAGFFVRDAEGSVKTDRSYLEFDFPDRLPAFIERAGERPGRDRRPPSLRRAEMSDAPVRERRERPEASSAPAQPFAPRGEESPPAFALPQFATAKPRRRNWLWLVGWAAVLVVAALLGLRYWMENSAPEPISLSLLEHDGQLLIEWNRSAKPVMKAVSGSLAIADGAQTETVSLNREQLAAGRFTYLRKTGTVEVRMTVQDAGGVKAQEESRYLGRAPEAPQSAQELHELEKRRDELEAEVQRLRQENNTQAARIQQLERLLRVLQTRLGIDSGKQ
ncbi:MAG TPA: hypothetical protein VKX39_04595 [Bryobacteraceae bacterium]|jgi:proteasome lid subunit RPN8/RPN11|nr:hypothetical protein [Bryobacteraceae bacterium]